MSKILQFPQPGQAYIPQQPAKAVPTIQGKHFMQAPYIIDAAKMYMVAGNEDAARLLLEASINFQSKNMICELDEGLYQLFIAAHEVD